MKTRPPGPAAAGHVAVVEGDAADDAIGAGQVHDVAARVGPEGQARRHDGIQVVGDVLVGVRAGVAVVRIGVDVAIGPDRVGPEIRIVAGTTRTGRDRRFGEDPLDPPGARAQRHGPGGVRGNRAGSSVRFSGGIRGSL